jgi:hypothetical protein
MSCLPVISRSLVLAIVALLSAVPLAPRSISHAQAAQTGTPVAVVPGVTDEVLAQAEITDLPETSIEWTGIIRATIPPGRALLVGSREDVGEGAYLLYVETGDITVETAGPASVSRDGAAPEPVTAGNELVLHRGDWGFTPTGTTSTWRNDGATDATLLQASLSGLGLHPDSPGVTQDNPVKNEQGWPDLPVVLTLRRLTVDPGITFRAAGIPDLAMFAVDAGSVELVYEQAEGTPTFRPTYREGMGVPMTEMFARAQLHNPGPEPLVLLALTLAPAEDGAGTPVP